MHLLKLKSVAKSETPGMLVSMMIDLNLCTPCIEAIRTFDFHLYGFYIQLCALHELGQVWIDLNKLIIAKGEDQEELRDNLLYYLESNGYIVTSDHGKDIILKPKFSHFDGKRIYCSCECGTLRLFEK